MKHAKLPLTLLVTIGAFGLAGPAAYFVKQNETMVVPVQPKEENAHSIFATLGGLKYAWYDNSWHKIVVDTVRSSNEHVEWRPLLPEQYFPKHAFGRLKLNDNFATSKGPFEVIRFEIFPDCTCKRGFRLWLRNGQDLKPLECEKALDAAVVEMAQIACPELMPALLALEPETTPYQQKVLAHLHASLKVAAPVEALVEDELNANTP